MELTKEEDLRMVKKDINQMLIESVIRRTLKNISDSPKRGLRNVIDLALNFASGYFQNNFLKTVQSMLQNQQSAYYKVAKNAADFVNHDTLCHFGINVGYNSCTKGANLIRQIEKSEHFSIPWFLTFLTDSENWTANKELYHDLICQGTNLGIYTYLFFTNDLLFDFSSFISAHSNCAFVLFTTPNALTQVWREDLKSLHNIMLSVNVASDSLDTVCSLCKKLRAENFLYSVFIEYNDSNKNIILDKSLFQSVMPYFPYFTFLFPDISCSDSTQTEIYNMINLIRSTQEYPSILFDLKYDNMLINHIISNTICTAVFDQNGRLYTDDFSSPNAFMKTHALKSIFQIVFQK